MNNQGVLQIANDDMYYSDAPTFRLGLTNEPLVGDTLPEADSVSLSLNGTVVASVTVDGVYVAEYTFSAIGVTLSRSITVAVASAADEAAAAFAKASLTGTDAEDKVTIEAALATMPSTMATPLQSWTFERAF